MSMIRLILKTLREGPRIFLLQHHTFYHDLTANLLIDRDLIISLSTGSVLC